MKVPKCFPMPLIVAACVLTAAASVLAAAPASSPTHKDIAYDKADPAQKLDVHLSKSDKPTPAMVFIHGGGWRAGTKNRVPA
jgi:acetyl esterase/lipase